jgi:multidrug efflux pump subunit AcrA (membrane-fusion protein)
VKVRSLLDELSARALDAPWLLSALGPVSPYGERVFDTCVPFRPGEEVPAATRARRVAGIAEKLLPAALDAARETMRSVPDAGTAIARASMGDALSDANLLELLRYVDACLRLDTLTGDVPELDRVANEAVRAVLGTLERGRAGGFGFYLDDAFAADLAAARASLAQMQAEYDAVRGRSVAAAAQALGREISGTEFIVMREDLRGSLPAGVRVVREAPTYVLCEIDADDASLAALDRRERAAAEVAAAEAGVRTALSDVVRTHAAALDASMQAFGTNDVLVAAARFAQQYRCVVADVVARPVVSFEEGVYVPLARELEREGRSFTPIALQLEDSAVLTGPNMGGKSVALRTCGFIALCAALGVPVPAARATVGLFGEIVWLGAGTEGEGGLLSSFAREVVRLRDVMNRGRTPALALLDEFARTTTPREGRAIVVAVLASLREAGAIAFAATHLSGVAEGAGVRHFAVRGLRGIPERPATDDLHAALQTLAASMDYTIEEVREGQERSSDAIALASLLGLDSRVVEAAYRELRNPATWTP